PWLLWIDFIGEPRKKAEKEEARRQRDRNRREARRKAVGATWFGLPGLTDRIGLDALDPATVPAAERYPWQPDGVVAIPGSHRGRPWAYGAAIPCVCWSPDGRRIYSGGDDGRVRVWEPDGLRELACLAGHSKTVLSVAASSDGRWLAACGGLFEEGWVR